MTRRRKLSLSGLALLLLLLATLELFCRFYLGLGDPPLSRADPEIEYLFVGPRTYHRFGNTIIYNSFSMRTHEFAARRQDPNELRIMVCGDSVINGGALTDQSRIMTTLLEEHLKKDLHHPTVVMNVSAGSWGPPNYLAYVKRFGFFEANALIIVVSSHDWADSPTFEPVVGVNPDFPDKTPTFALEEALTRYLPRYIPHWGAVGYGGGGADGAVGPTQGQIDQSMSAFEELVEMAQARRIPVIVAQHLQRDELGKPEVEGHRAFREQIELLHPDHVDWGDAFAAAIKAGHTVYRDDIHPNEEGQAIMEAALYPLVVEKVSPK